MWKLCASNKADENATKPAKQEQKEKKKDGQLCVSVRSPTGGPDLRTQRVRKGGTGDCVQPGAKARHCLLASSFSLAVRDANLQFPCPPTLCVTQKKIELRSLGLAPLLSQNRLALLVITAQTVVVLALFSLSWDRILPTQNGCNSPDTETGRVLTATRHFSFAKAHCVLS
ncbi:hypothetical protein CCM_05928 [Cordyceps militaris CM01]|uniref:Uncharacterized protein n=1 Tax=Cordyceps militaris (strain CM01) TaxID=983644 RepID=G3JHR5_CORMM|nr:uncharacterized protein CCM_05928 [Cordyceps militaris CM01]EGX91771.1 hypothetical protein CCM_05928 [Cordyceps militaris CM01]